MTIKTFYPQIAYGAAAGALLLGLLLTTTHDEVVDSQTGVETTVPAFTDYPAGDARKQAFFNYFGPIIESENERVDALRTRLLEIREKSSPSDEDMAFIQQVAEQHRVKVSRQETERFWNELMRKVDVVPVSLALAQAANESAWGTSRFAQEAHNYFGQWCFKRGCGVVPKQRAEGMNHEVKSFDHPAASVRSYIRNLNSHPAYRDLRLRRASLRSNERPLSGTDLAEGLEQYSERGEDYVEEIQAMIRHNRLGQLDSA